MSDDTANPAFYVFYQDETTDAVVAEPVTEPTATSDAEPVIVGLPHGDAWTQWLADLDAWHDAHNPGWRDR